MNDPWIVDRARFRMWLFDQLPREIREQIAEHNASDYQLRSLVEAYVEFIGAEDKREIPQGLVRHRR